jgi:FkbM family methyltransferase
MNQLPFGSRPSSFTPVSVLAYACTRLGPRLDRRFGKYGFNAQARVLRPNRFHPSVRAVAGDCAFEFPALDQYCADMFFGGGYETELFTVLDSLADDDYCFIDAGANLGYWSVLASGSRLGQHQVVAVEASPRTFGLLLRNARLNDDRFVAVHAAVHERSGDVLAFDDESEHAARKVIDSSPRSSQPPTVVVSVAIDDLVARFAPDAKAFVVKLDVEGAEVAAMAGAERIVRERDVLLLVEEHGSDRQHSVTTQLLSRGLDVHFLQPDAVPIRITRPAQLDELKSDHARGYNVAAHRPSSALAATAGLTRSVPK